LASAWEGLPRTVLEAQAAGVPVVSTAVSGIEEVVRHGETGFLADSGDWRSLGDAATHLLLNTQLRERMGNRARQIVTNAYSVEHMVEATAALYYRLLARSRSGLNRPRG